MAQYKVFSQVESMAGQELWKDRGIMTADSDGEAMNMVAKIDALENKPGDVKKYAACRESSWVEWPYEFKVTAQEQELDRGVVAG